MGSPHETEQLYTPKAAASLMAMHVDTVRHLCRVGPERGGLRTVRNGPRGHFKIPATAIAEYTQRNTYNPAP